jgi:HTH-type transcriptional regulator/antitoxin HigA
METKVKLIKTEQEYELALEKLETIFHAKVGTQEGDELEVLSLLIHEYEQKHHAIKLLSPLEALKYEMEEQGISQTGLAKRLGIAKSTVSEIIHGKREMSLKFMRFIHKELGIPASVLLT